MFRVFIIGRSGSGKTTLAKQLAKKLNLKVIHLDQLFWKSEKEWREAAEFRKLVGNLCLQESWIIEGHYSDVFDLIFSKADTIIYLDFSLLRCLYYELKRRLSSCFADDRKEIRPNISFFKALSFVVGFSKHDKQKVKKAAESLQNQKDFIICKSPQEFKRKLHL
ncbi:MAG: hypothetical protein A2Z91_08050 [Deltaproteobacteria bacterium GWA2_38_16]|nr:MAG: hypothetical protein A2Z91_08050 [Deltaproteobacteria bacterium GWA2_38_16]OGQ03463.1 MAG: hypothetical protein A3D19_00290 [Deltaproteobacteria bacterium RIFCSPHIGHO2_02_FULL_38_15]OGQ34746.1 MAG: hypothetical protein A3A72_06655 [Deltaproteobacteria bacterium RIFCSPLOWO2_01_FULL_38_9]OGQ59260.1 MAG: hypothetical protein A3G92_01425 [Deltaproteobacteria bacterium RIFCSPLOWO2_12_FULL_38_8]HBQ20532.1 topology modulation protein [Deltaproteobacteria bacterium]